VPQGVQVQVLSRAQAVISFDGDYSLVVEPQLVELVARVRFSLVAHEILRNVMTIKFQYIHLKAQYL
jgi:hypothetical protein